MYPHDLHLGPFTLSVWNTVFVLSVLGACLVFHRSLAGKRDSPFFAGMRRHGRLGTTLRYFVFVYLAAISAQFFAYAFDAHTSMTPPPEVSRLRWYLDPLAGPKTLYGVIVLAPVSVVVATAGARLSLLRGLDLWTPAMLTVLATVRVGCLLQGCCHGARSDAFGVSFPPGSPVYWKQLGEGLTVEGAWTLPVVPTQAWEALFLAVLAAWAIRREDDLAAGRLFAVAVGCYSVFRFAVEFVRADAERGIYAGLATSQWIALVVLAALAAAMLGCRRAAGAAAASTLDGAAAATTVRPVAGSLPPAP